MAMCDATSTPVTLDEALDVIRKQGLEIQALKIANEKLYAVCKEQEKTLDEFERSYGCLNSKSDNSCNSWISKPYSELTVEDIETLIRCRDSNDESLCGQGCKFHFDMPWGGCCFKHAFFSNFFEYCQNLGIISDATGEWVVNKNNEGDLNDGKQNE